MQKILVPTDFSKASENALKYAIDLANRFGSTLTLVNTYKVYSTAGMLISVEAHMRDEAARDMLGLVKRVEALLRDDRGARLESQLVHGDAVPTIAKIADKGYDLIVMGTHGSSAVEEIFSGSVTNGVIKESKVPVLAIPDKFTYRSINRIVLALDAGPISEAGVLRALLEISKAYQAEVKVFHHLSPDEKEEKLHPSVSEQLQAVECSVHYAKDSESVNDSINEFVRSEKADLLCLIHRNRNFWQNLFHTSVTSRESFDSPVPLLVLHDKA